MKQTIGLYLLTLAAFGGDKPLPTLSTSRYWRLVAQAQAAKAVADQTPQAKAAQAADAAVQAEIQEMQKVCGGDNLLALDDDAKSPTYQDVICKAKPTPAEKKN